MLAFATFSLALTSCTNGEKPKESDSADSEIRYDDINFADSIPDIDIQEKSFEPTEIGSKDDPAQEIDVSEIGDDMLCSYTDSSPHSRLRLFPQVHTSPLIF